MRAVVPLLLVLAAALALGCGVASPVAPEAPTTGSAPAGPPGMPVVRVVDLPAEAADVLALIATDGPFPYRQDGATFQNREGLLPPADPGHYREYTVPTPGEDDRGARRIVSGAAGERYWTADHYDSFAWIVP